ncbi:MAG: hypothetical protein QXR53_01895 [Candidatus Norongarragalinales archaeon]
MRVSEEADEKKNRKKDKGNSLRRKVERKEACFRRKRVGWPKVGSNSQAETTTRKLSGGGTNRDYLFGGFEVERAKNGFHNFKYRFGYSKLREKAARHALAESPAKKLF